MDRRFRHVPVICVPEGARSAPDIMTRAPVEVCLFLRIQKCHHPCHRAQPHTLAPRRMDVLPVNDLHAVLSPLSVSGYGVDIQSASEQTIVATWCCRVNSILLDS